MLAVQLIRVLIAALNLFCLIVLVVRYAKFRTTWKPETRDLWITLTFWSVAALVTAIQGFIQARPISAALITLGIASCATPVVLRRKKRERSSASYLDS